MPKPIKVENMTFIERAEALGNGFLTYRPIDAGDVPADVRFTTPRRYQGQRGEVSFGGAGQGPFDAGDPYKRLKSEEGTVSFYRLEKRDEE